jgi:hypothetical protein
MEKVFSGKKRGKEECKSKKEKNVDEDENDKEDEVSFDLEEDFEELKKNFKFKKDKKVLGYAKLPHKSEYRMRAHCNPLSDTIMV